jgi:MGT family glycosyltransferase
LPGDPLVVNYAPQAELLARASALITHAGLNTVMEALAAGVPMIAIPITGDQFGVAARIAYRGAGEVIQAVQCRAGAVAAAVHQVLHEDRYRARAVELQRAIEQTRGAAAAAEIIEQVTGTGRAVRAG